MQTITEVRDKVTANVKPVLDAAVEKSTPVLTSAIERAIGVVERIDPDASNREAYFRNQEPAASAVSSSEEAKAAAASTVQEESKSTGAAGSEGLQRLKVVTEDLLDLWLFEGSKGLSHI